MRWFYVISGGIVLILTASPLLLVQGEDLSRFRGKIVSYNAYGAKVRSLDPATCGDTTSSGIQTNFYEGLYCYHYLKRPPTVIPQLAAELPKISPDGLTYTIRLKSGVKFARNACFGKGADGRAATRTVRADDFVLAFKRIADYHVTTELSLAFIEDKIVGLTEYRQATQAYEKGDFSRYDKVSLPGVHALDDLTLQIKLKKPFPQLLEVLALQVYAPIPREVIDYYLASQDDGAGGRKPVPLRQRQTEITDFHAAVGTGPYVLTEFVRGGNIILDRNPDYRDDFYPTEGEPGDAEAGLLKDAGKKVPFIDVQYLTYVAEENPSWMLFATMQRDTAGIPQDVYSHVISPSKDLMSQWESRGIRLMKDASSASVYWYAFNLDDPVVGKSKSLRQALSLAYSVEDHIEILFNGRGIRALSMIPRSFAGFTEAGPSPYARFDLKAAKAKLEDARKELTAAGVIQPGEPIPALTMDMPGREEDTMRMGEFAQRQFKQIGVELKIVPNDWPTLQQKVHNKQCQIYAMGWQADYPDAENFLQLYYSPNIERGTNNTNYSNKAFDALYEKAAVEMDEAKRVRMYVQMLHMLYEDTPVLLLSEPVTYLLLYPWVHNEKLHPIGSGYLKYIRLDVDLRRKMGGR